ncbi:MAG: AMP-binding protein [Alphaproteobacteria bacterium]|jgi:oxalate---CoA ligase|nr:AMP-binding protein [Alphaproteobacteria bacterium]
MTETILNLIDGGADDAVALAAPDRKPLTYAGLRALAAKTISDMNTLGIGRNDRVAIVLPNGPEMAAAFIAVGAGATTAPLNPGYRGEEFRFYLEDLGAKALFVEAGSQSPAIDVARDLGVAVYELDVPDGSPAGTFEIAAGENGAGVPALPGAAEPEDVGLVLHTSGTTSRPKIVPLSQTNICASGRHIGETLGLTGDDCCVNIMPLFHIHGLIAAVLSSMAAGGSTYCTPGFDALRVFRWFEDATPSWYTAVPTMHQAILSRAGRNQDILDAMDLRFIRSSSSSLPPQVMVALEETFGCPVIESYGMTEAAHQMASNLLPPGARKAGSVGVAAGPEVEIMDLDGKIMDRGATGEIVIRGPNVTKGYEANEKANAEGFTNGWFRTGDQGMFDEDGYLSITGRLKEIINRGGEKISPREVDEILLDHPAVGQAVTFALPHEKLGEEVAAAVVLKEGESATETDIREFAATHLADFKVPRKVIFLEEIPKGATGKLQRIGLHEKLGL